MGVVNQVLKSVCGQDGNAFFLAFKNIFVRHFLDDFIVMLFFFLVEEVEELFVEAELVEGHQFLMDGRDSLDVVLGDTAWVVDNCWKDFEGFGNEDFDFLFEQVVSLALGRNEVVELELFELELGLALYQHGESVRCLIEEIFVHLWLERINLLELIIIELDVVIELFPDDSSDGVVQDLGNVSLLTRVVRGDVDDFLLILIEDLWDVIVADVKRREVVLVGLLEGQLVAQNFHNVAIPNEWNQCDLLDQV